MKSFAITEDQITRVIGGVFADELSRRFNRHFDFITTASWTGETMLGEGGLGLNEDQQAVCQRRAAALFGLKRGFFENRAAADFSAMAEAIGAAVNDRLEGFVFLSAARDDGDAECRHCADEIFQDAAAAANILYGRRRLLSFVAPHSLLGFELTILTPNLQGIESIDARGATPEQLSAKLAYGDVLVATPTLWRYMIREKLTSPDNTMAVSFGEAMAPDLAVEMRKAGFGVMRELYGSTESGLMGWRDSPTESFVLFDHWHRESAQLIRRAPDGSERATPAMDFLEWTGERAFRLAGRRDGAIQIGAVNVQPSDVVLQLRQHPAVEECAVNVSRSGDGVTRLVAHIALNRDRTPDETTARDIDAWCRARLRQQERPRIYQFHRSIPE